MDCDDHQSSPESSVDSAPKFATELSTCDMNTIEISSPSSFSWASYSYSPNQSISYCLPSPVKRTWSESSLGQSQQKKPAPKSPADNHPKVGDLVESIRKNAAVWQPPQTVDDDATVSQGNRFDLLDIRAYEDSLRRANEREFNPQKSLDESDFIKQLRAACKNYHAKYSPKKKRITKDKSYSPYLKTPPSGSFSYIVRPSPRRIFSPRQLWAPERPIYKMHLDQESQTIVSQLVGVSSSKSGPAAPNSKCGVSLTRPYMNRFLEVPNNAKMDYKPLKSSEGVSVQICGELEVLPRMGSSGVTYGKVRFEPNAMKAFARCTKFARLNVLIGQFGMRIKEQGDDMSDERVIEAGDCFSLASGTKYTITNLTDQEAIIDFTVFI